MRRITTWFALLLLSGGFVSAEGQAPPPDTSASFFSGEWEGTGEQGSYCYVKLDAEGSGWVLVDAGAGDWSGAGIQWRNRQQSLQVENVTPLRASPQERLMPLEHFVLRSELNRSLSLSWTGPSAGCHLQRIDAMAQHLGRARGVAGKLRREPGDP